MKHFSFQFEPTDFCFRGKDDKMNWRYGHLLKDKNGNCLIVPTIDDVKRKSPYVPYTYRVDKKTVGISCGITYGNMPVFSGDILRIKTSNGRIENTLVKWGLHRRQMGTGFMVDIPSFSFIVDGKATFPIVHNYLQEHDLDIMELIGNIVDNPELYDTIYPADSIPEP